ncbi:MAG: PBSX family phage terminase large subunit [Oscillospiraceae bacterium]
MNKRRKIEFSDKQKKIFLWWRTPGLSDLDGIICDGAVRSGKTMCMSLSFVLWSMTSFSGQSFGICGKTISSVRRNILQTLFPLAKKEGFSITEKQSKNYFDITLGGIVNRYYIFGGKDESSASLIQGVTLAGVLFDETALMPRSFVEQAIARCSVTGSKLWFNCNPEHRSHWFKREWIDKAREKRLYYLHFVLDDNPSLSKQVKERYRRLYSGAFYERFILGKWSDVSGLIYPMFSEKDHVVSELPKSFERYAASCDYGTVNPTSIGLWGLSGKVWYRISEYYYDSKREGEVRTDEEHYEALERLCGGRKIEKIICDPSAASFIACIRRHGKYAVVPAKNDVISGIRRTADLLGSGRIKISSACADCIREFSLYRWDDSAAADRPLKENDHAMDDVRYFAADIDGGGSDFLVLSLSRSA